jgi:hypothetical protein
MTQQEHFKTENNGKLEQDAQSIALEFRFAPHRNVEDMKGFEESLNKANVYIPEMNRWNAEILKNWRDVSTGKKLPQDVPYSSYVQLEELEKIYNTNKIIEFIDLPYDHSIQAEREDACKFFYQAINRRSWEFSEMVSDMRIYLEKFADVQVKREEYMASQIEKIKSEIFTNHPELADKEGIKILISLGSFHTWVYYDAKKKNSSTSRTFNEMPVVFDNQTELLRRLRFKKGHEKISNEEVARLWLIYQIKTGHVETVNDSLLFGKYLRLAASKFSLKEIKSLFEKDANNIKIGKLLEEKGVEYPNNEEAARTILAQNGKM